jgi:hypothetical protein
MSESILDRWELTVSELTQIIDENPSLRGIVLGYIAEFQLRKIWFYDNRVSNVFKYDDHDRKKKNDLVITYKGHDFTIEVKSLQTNSVKWRGESFTGTFQCDASDRRKVILPNGTQLETTCLLAGDFDIVAVNLFAFTGKWDFGFALNADLPRSISKKYTTEQQNYLLASSMKISWPLKHPYIADPYILLDRLVAENTLLS